MATQTEPAVLVRAAGVLPWRRHEEQLQFALVHRSRYDDWSWPKGKLERHEEGAVAAVRETQEETGLQVRLGVPLPVSWYALGAKDGRAQVKQVHYWAGTVTGGDGLLQHEVDEVVWLSAADAAQRLTYRRDKEQLEAAQEAHEAGVLDTWPLLLVRHAHALGRGSWAGADADRPLTGAGRRRAAHLVPLLAAYQPTTLLTSPSVRCADSLQPYGRQTGLELTGRKGLSEEGHAEDPRKALKHLRTLLQTAQPAALCTHRPVLPDLLEALTDRALQTRTRAMLARLARTGLAKGEVLVLHCAGAGAAVRVVEVERHRPVP